MRIEWCKARARAMRWEEEVDLLQEETRRILQFFEWEALRWDEHVAASTDEVADHESRIAYARRQASLRRRLAQRFQDMWADTLSFLQVQKSANVHATGTALITSG
jgi:hypothetical protein